MNAFMVFSNYERKRVLKEHPEIQNTELSRELGRRWNRLSAADRQPFMAESDRLRVLHSREYPNYKYKPAKKRNKPAKQDQNSGLPAPKLEIGASWASSACRISISQGRRGILKSINTNRLQHRLTIDKKFKDALRRANSSLTKPFPGFVSLGQSSGESCSRSSSSPLKKCITIPPSSSWSTMRLTQSVPTSPDLAHHQPNLAQTVPSNSCPNTPLAPPSNRLLTSPLSWSDQEATSLPDLSQILSTNLETDLNLDWTDEQVENLNLNLNLNSDDLEFADQWFNKQIFSNIL